MFASARHLDQTPISIPQPSKHRKHSPSSRAIQTPAPSSRCRASLLCAARTAVVASRYPVKIRGRPFSGPWQHVTGPLEPPKLISFRVHPTTRRVFIDQTGQGQGAQERGFLESTSDPKRLINQLLGTNHEPRIFNLQEKTRLHNSGLVLGADQGTAGQLAKH